MNGKTLPRIYDNLDSLLKNNRVTVIYGPRRVGKTTLVKSFLEKTPLQSKFTTGDDIGTQQVFSSQSLKNIKDFAENNELIVIDEAQRIPDVGLGLKILVDNVAGIKVIITGSASLDLSYKIGEPLVGRKYTYILYPLSQKELLEQEGQLELKSKKDNFLIYGSYPEILTADTQEEKIKILTEIVNSYLLRDIMELEKVKGSKVLMDLLALVALQIGSEVSLNELGNSLNIDKKTVARYLDLFEQSFILYNLRGYSMNLRKAVSKKSKYYFLDNGIRNAIIGNFAPLNRRNDVGQLWENFIIGERLKKQQYDHIYANNYFWRTWDQEEIDWVEMRDGKLFGYEIKWNDRRRSKGQKAWLSSYKEAEFEIINSDNYLEFIT